MDVKEYKIAGHTMRIEGASLVNVMSALEGFAPFAVEPGMESPVVTVTCQGTDMMIVPKCERECFVFDSDDVLSTFGETSDGFIFLMAPQYGKDEPLCLWCKRGDSIMYVKGHLEGGPMTERLVRFALWIAYGLATVRKQTIAIHTSTIQYKDKAVLFLGESGTGKSTHTRLWRENIDGAILLNDDSPIVRYVDGKMWVYGSPWSGKTPCYKNEQYELAGCVRLSQAPYNKIRKLRTIEAFAAIHPSCPPDFAYSDYLYDGISETLDVMLQVSPFYHLECLPNAEAAYLSCKTIFGE
ncbi:MAG: hypothetical protein KBT33_09915 [Prevotellaceae bacterium]|nr:hypothetical protein [Candidatus Minthosoma equi]